MQRFLVAVVVWGALAVAAVAEVRTWQDSTGSYSTKAEFVRMSGQIVELRLEDGETIKIPLARLSKADQDFIRKLKSAPLSAFDKGTGSFIHPDFCAAIVVHPQRITNASMGKSLRLPELIGILAGNLGRDSDAVVRACDPSKILRISILIEPLPGGNVAFFPGVVVEFSEDVSGQQVVRALWPKSRLSASDKQRITGLDEMAGVEIEAYIAGPRTLLIAPATMMKLMRSAPQSRPNLLKEKLRRSLDESEIVVTYVSRPVQMAIQKMTGLTDRQLRDDPDTDEFVKFVAMNVTSGSIKIQLKESPSLAASIDCTALNDATQAKETISGGVAMLSTAISTTESRKELKKELAEEFPPPILEFVDSPASRKLVESIAVRQRGRRVDLLVGIPKSAVLLLKKSVDEFADASRPIADRGEWTVIFRSSDPRIWNTNVDDGENRFAVSLSRVSAGIKFLRLKIDDERFVIIEMTKRNLGRQSEAGNIGWVGTNLNKWNGRHLGIYNKRWTDEVRGSVHIWPLQNRGIRGWGFGNHVKLDDGQSYAWGGKTIKKTVFEFSVKSSELTAAEKKALLR